MRGENYSVASRTHNRIRSSRLKASSFLENVDKGSRQISIVTLGKGMALVVRCGSLEAERGRAGRDDGCYPLRGGWLSSAWLVFPRSADWIEVVAISVVRHLG